MQASLAFAFHFDRAIIEELDLIQRLLALPLGARSVQELIEVQTYMPLATGRLKKPARFNWSRLKRTVGQGDVILFGLGTGAGRSDPEQIEIRLRCIAPANRALTEMDLHLPYRYQGHLSLGAAVLAWCPDADGLVATVFEQFVVHIGLAAGVVVAAPSHSEAVGVAICSGGLPGTELDVRTGRLWGARRTWGPYAREPEWGTFLQRRHADAIGGPAAIRAAVEPFAVLEAGDVVFVQLTPYADALSPAAEAKRVALEALMQPILGAPSSRDPGGSRLDRG